MIDLPWAMTLLAAGVALGALMMFFYDPASGHRRRGLLTGQVNRTGQALDEAFESARHGGDAEGWSPATRMLTGLAGSLLVIMWIGWTGFVTAMLGLIGIGMLARSITNRELRRIAGIRREAPELHPARRG